MVVKSKNGPLDRFFAPFYPYTEIFSEKKFRFHFLFYFVLGGAHIGAHVLNNMDPESGEIANWKKMLEISEILEKNCKLEKIIRNFGNFEKKIANWKKIWKFRKKIANWKKMQYCKKT